MKAFSCLMLLVFYLLLHIIKVRKARKEAQPMLQIFILFSLINLVLVGVYAALQNVFPFKMVIGLVITALLSSISVYSGILFSIVLASLVLRKLGDYHTDIKRIKEEEHDMYFHN